MALYRERLVTARTELCPCGCGNPAALTLVPEEDGPEWVVEETTCTARFALIEKQNAVAESRAKYARAGLWSVRPRKR